MLQKLAIKNLFSSAIFKHSHNKRNQLIDKIRKKLTILFQSQKKIMLLSKTFQIFPSYFHKKNIQKMLQSQHMEQYLNYLNITKGSLSQIDSSRHQKSAQKQKDKNQLRQILEAVRMDRSEEQRILQIFLNFIKRNFDLSQSNMLMQIFDIRNPQNWFKSKLVGDRKFIYHHGPTNSGKTYSAINQLKNLPANKKGVYMAPLRLLAWQTQQKLGKCNLVTGQQKDYKNSNVTSCTIEAVKLNQLHDIAIVDQIQMIGDINRGWSWTTSILGIRANRIHLCGDQRALGLVSKLIEKSGGTLEQKKYNRLSKLHLIKRIFDINDIRPGDCIIQFSSSNLYKLRDKINKLKGTPQIPTKTAIIYGKMPPSCRQQQAQKFNSGQLPYLVASDAIGMGLNLKIRRIIFITLLKLSSQKVEKVLQDHEIRQIAGRAGRGYGHGYVQCANIDMRERVKYALRNVNITIEDNIEASQDKYYNDEEENSMIQKNNQKVQQNVKESEETREEQKQLQTQVFCNHLKRYLKYDQTKIKKAGIFFPITIIERIKMKIEQLLGHKLKTSETINLIINLSKQNKDLFFIQHNKQLLQLSDQLQHLNLPFNIHYLFSQIPVPNNSTKFKLVVLQFAKQFKYNGVVSLPVELYRNYKNNYEQYTQLYEIRHLQDQYLIAEAYTWLWNHLQLYFPYNDICIKIKTAICNKMSELLKLPMTKSENYMKNKRYRRLDRLKIQKNQQQNTNKAKTNQTQPDANKTNQQMQSTIKETQSTNTNTNIMENNSKSDKDKSDKQSIAS